MTKLAILTVEGTKEEGVRGNFENMVAQFGRHHRVNWQACEFQRNLFYPRDDRGFCDNLTETFTGFIVYQDYEDLPERGDM